MCLLESLQANVKEGPHLKSGNLTRVLDKLASHIFCFSACGNLSDMIDDIYPLLALKQTTDVTSSSSPTLVNWINYVFPLLPNILAVCYFSEVLFHL
jgi:hypothetical protein